MSTKPGQLHALVQSQTKIDRTAILGQHGPGIDIIAVEHVVDIELTKQRPAGTIDGAQPEAVYLERGSLRIGGKRPARQYAPYNAGRRR